AALEPVRLSYGATVTEGLTFNRRPTYGEQGEVGTLGPLWAEDFAGLEGPADEQLQVLLAERPDGSIAGGLVGFACHPYVTAPEPVRSGDFPTALVEKLAARYGGTFLFLQGAQGNLHWLDLSSELPHWEIFVAGISTATWPNGFPWNGVEV